MYTRHIVATLLIALTPAATAACSTDAAATESVIATERAALDRWGKGDPQGYLGTYTSDITYFDPMQDRRVDGLDAMQKLLIPLTGKIKIDHYEMIAPKVQQYGDVAVLTYNLNSQGTGPDGKPTSVRWNSTAVYRRQGDGWRSVHSHWSFVRPAGDRVTP